MYMLTAKMIVLCSSN